MSQPLIALSYFLCWNLAPLSRRSYLQKNRDSHPVPPSFTMSPGRLASSCDEARIPLNNNDQPAQTVLPIAVCRPAVWVGGRLKRDVVESRLDSDEAELEIFFNQLEIGAKSGEWLAALFYAIGVDYA